MPLRTGSSDEAFEENVRRLVSEGRSQDQALAIAYKIQRGEGARGPAARCAMIRAALGAPAGRAWPENDEPPDAYERAVFDVPISRWANAEGRGAEEALGRAGRAGRGTGRPDAGDAPTGRGGAGMGGDPARVPNVQQGTGYTCGPAALRAAALAFGVGASEDELAATAGTTAAGGTSSEGLAWAADALGLRAEARSGLDVEELTRLLDEGSVVLACVQAPRAGDSPADSSHWVVATAVHDDVVELMDPTVPDAVATVPVDEFAERWHGLDGDGDERGVAVVLSAPDGGEPARGDLELPRAAY